MLILIGALLCVHGVHIEYDGVVVQAAATATAVAFARVTAMCLGSCDHPLEVGGWVQGDMQLLIGSYTFMIFPYTDTRVLSSREGDSK